MSYRFEHGTWNIPGRERKITTKNGTLLISFIYENYLHKLTLINLIIR